MTEQTEKKKSFKDTLNLPKTTFNMKANLVQNEPATLKRWQQVKLYEHVRAARHTTDAAKRYVFHDGPPYANGSIHLGHLLNKVLKDLVVRTKTMAGFDVPYIPGWDCHGLPIEHKVMQELGDKARGMVPLQIRKRCSDYAEKFIKLQRGQMERLLTLADYENPYLTMDPKFEAATLEVFADLVGKGLVYRALKPVHWSIANQTALAEAELEYEDREDTSVYVLFEVAAESRDGMLDEFVGENSPLHEGGEKVYVMIWTTTPWTLPANLAVAVAPNYRYALTRLAGKLVVLADELANKVAMAGGANIVETLGLAEGFNLVGMRYVHPFIERAVTSSCTAAPTSSSTAAAAADAIWTIVAADYVTLEDGTGLVHTAPGHGVEDYQTGLREKLPIYCPVKADGTFDDTAPDWLRGKSVWEANKLVVDRLRESGHLFHAHQFLHSYPHDWRSKTPVIFRATEQWFVGVDKPFPTSPLRERSAESARPGEGEASKSSATSAASVRSSSSQTSPSPQPSPSEGEGVRTLRRLALSQTAKDVQFIPEWGRNRMRGMLESRPDWCLSRQRAWGLPIPAFFGAKPGEVLITKASVQAVAEVVRQHGSDAWFKLEPKELLAGYDVKNDPDAPSWLKTHGQESMGFDGLKKGPDIFDVWFESGSSWNAVLVQRGLAHDPKDRPVTDLYLEGSDQHRGWFQCSLLPALGVTGRSPFATVLTHGFMVDKDGKKMSKSLGNTLEVEDLLKEYGADVCRWWVCSLNTDNDIKVDKSYFQVAGEEYRKVRNTIRFLLSNLYDFEKPMHSHAWVAADATSIDAWAMNELNRLISRVTSAYAHFDFKTAREAIFSFCNETMSAVYLAATKDRLYCDKPDSPRRRRTQTAMYEITDALIRLIAPVLPHTADEAWAALLQRDVKDGPSVHLEGFPIMSEVKADDGWPELMEIRRKALGHTEGMRQRLGIDNPLDCGVSINTGPEMLARVQRFEANDLADLCGVSRFVSQSVGPGAGSMLGFNDCDLRNEPRCDRSWKRDGTVKPRSDGSMLSDRDAASVGLA